MSSKTRTRKTRTTASTTSPARTLQSVPDQTTAAKARTDTEDKLWEALHANPNSTAADLSVAAKIGKSTAQKFLVKWASDGSVTRTAGIADGGRRAADLWAITDVDAAPVDAAPADDAHLADTTQDDPDNPVAPDTTDVDTPAEGDPTETTNTEPTDPTEAEPADTATDGGGDDKAARLAPGALRGMVEDYLRDHPGEEFGPTAIANTLGGKSSGAVSNALDKLVEDKTAVKTKDKPRRFALAPEAAAAPAPTN
jgi:hypothetical protein